MRPDDPQAHSPVSSSSPVGRPAWYAGATRGQWLALAAALLGWAFDGFEQGVFPLVARPALIELNGLSREEQLLKETRDRASFPWGPVHAAARAATSRMAVRMLLALS